MPIAKPEDVDQCHPEYIKMLPTWELLDALYGGTRTMRDGGQKWLPREPNEDLERFSNRLNRSILFNGLRDTVKSNADRPFRRAVILDGVKDERIVSLQKSADRQGRTLTQFFREVMRSAVRYGFMHVLTDYPTDRPENLAQEREMKIRPYFVQVTPVALFNWRFGVDGSLEEIRIRGEENVAGIVYPDCIKIINTTSWEVWVPKKNSTLGKTEWTQIAEGAHTFGSVPLRTLFLDRSGDFSAEPPFEDLAWLNLAHWQSSSDHRNFLRFARVGILFFKGVSSDEQKGFVLAPGAKLTVEDNQADGKYIETSGSTIKLGQEDLEKLEGRMEILGMRPRIQKVSGVTATGRSIDEGRAVTVLEAWTMELADTIAACVQDACKWISISEPNLKVDVYNDFSMSDEDSKRADQLIQARQLGDIDRKTFLEELKRYGVLDEDTDVETIMDAVEKEGPTLATLGEPNAPGPVHPPEPVSGTV